MSKMRKLKSICCLATNIFYDYVKYFLIINIVNKVDCAVKDWLNLKIYENLQAAIKCLILNQWDFYFLKPYLWYFCVMKFVFVMLTIVSEDVLKSNAGECIICFDDMKEGIALFLLFVNVEVKTCWYFFLQYFHFILREEWVLLNVCYRAIDGTCKFFQQIYMLPLTISDKVQLWKVHVTTTMHIEVLQIKLKLYY